MDEKPYKVAERPMASTSKHRGFTRQMKTTENQVAPSPNGSGRLDRNAPNSGTAGDRRLQ